MIKLLLVFVLYLSWQWCTAQAPPLYFEKINVESGLSHNKVNCIYQDKRGFIWLGTDDGLNRYDGKNFIIYRHQPNQPASLSGNIITDLLEDKQGRMWIATADGGLTRYDYQLPPQQQFRQYRHSPGNAASIPVNIINSLAEDRFGNLWLGTGGKSVLRFIKHTERFEEMAPEGIRTVFDLCFDKDGWLWAGRQGGGILKINPVTGATREDKRYRNLYAKLPHVAVTALYTDSEKNIWFGSWDKVLYRHHFLTGKEEAYKPQQASHFEGDEVISFSEDDEGKLWIGGSTKGLHVYDRKQATFHHYQYDPSKDGTIADNRINCIFKDREGRMWLGTNKGVCISNAGRQQFVQTFLQKGTTASSLRIYDFFEAEEGIIWIGTSDGLYIKNKEGIITQHRLLYKGVPLQVTCFYKDNQGRLFLGTDYTLFQYNARSNTITVLPNTGKDSVMQRIINSRIVSVVQHRINNNNVIITAPYGHFIAYYDLQKKQWISRLDKTHNIIDSLNLKDNLIRKLYPSKAGDIWMATAKEGLGVWLQGYPKTVFFKNHPEDSSSISSNNVYDITEDNRGNLWVSTYGGGLNYFNTRKKQFTQITASNNLGEGLITDHHQQVWIISNGNLHKYDPKQNTYTSYTLPDLEKTGGVRGNIFKDSKGKLYIAGTNYFISFHPDSVYVAQPATKVYLTDFSIFNHSFSHLLHRNAIRLNYKDNYFTIEFAAPHFGSDRAHYTYMLEGFDQDWVEAGNRTYASYSNLKGGTYTFKVKASTSPGRAGSDYTFVMIEVVPPFWKRWWFFLVCGFGAAAAVYAAYRYRINELLKRQAIRNKIAQDLHDNVGSTLSSISVYSQVAKIYHQQHKQEDLQSTLEKISVTSTEMISELNDTVWVINPRNDNMVIILQRMESFARPLLASQGIQFHFQHEQHLSALDLDMGKRKNFYLIFKEALNNTLKYAACKNLTVTIRQKAAAIVMHMTDDGKGFDLTKTSEGYKSSDVFGGGNGLTNMYLRAKEMKGRLHIETSPGKGCTVELIFPITGFGDRQKQNNT